MHARGDGHQHWSGGAVGRRLVVPVLLLTVASMLVGLMPVAAATQAAAGDGAAVRTSEVQVESVQAGGTGSPAPGWDFFGGQPLPVTPLATTCGGTGQPACPDSTVVSGGSGGYIPVAAERVLDTVASGKPLGKGETRTVPVGGAGSVPLDAVEAVALSIMAVDATAWTELTVWPAGAARPSLKTLDAQPGSAHRVLSLVPLGTDGSISIYNDQGRTNLQVEVIGYLSTTDEYRSVAPSRLLDTNPGTKGGRPAPLGPDATVTVKVLDRAGVPAEKVHAVALLVTSRTATASSPVQVWPTGAGRPAGASLIALANDRRSNLVLVAPGTNGTVSIHNTLGSTHLTVDVLGWFPESGGYRPVPATGIYATPSNGSLGMGQSVEITVAGQGGVPALPGGTAGSTTEQAKSVVLVTTATPVGTSPTRLTLWNAADDMPATTSLASTNAASAVTSTTVVPLSADGKVRLGNLGPAARVTVQVAGWFAMPVVAAQLEVPDTTVVPAEAAVEDVVLATDPDDPETVTGGVVTLDASAAAGLEPGDHLVLGVTPETPAGYLGTVEAAAPQPDGTVDVTTVAAKLVDVFPEGDIDFDVAANEPVAAQVPGLMATTVAMPDPTEQPGSDMEEVDNPFDEAPPACSASGLTLDYGPFFDMRFGLSWRSALSPVVTALATIGAEARLKLNDIVLTCGWDKVLFKTTYAFMVGTVPVVLQTKISAELDLDAGLRGIDLGAEAKVWVTFGIDHNTPVADAGYKFNTSGLGDLMATAAYLTAYAQVDMWVDIGVMLYGIIGPSVGVGPFLETTLSAKPADPPTPWFTLDIGLAGRAAITLDLWFYEHTWKVAEGELPLAWLLNKAGALPKCTGESEAFFDGTPCMSPVPKERANGDTGRYRSNRIRLVSSTTGITPLRIAVPEVPIMRPGTAASLAFTATGQFVGIDGVLWRVAPDADGSPGTGVPGLAFTRAAGDPAGWSSTGILAGAPTRSGTFSVPIEVRYTDEGPHPENADRQVTPVTVRVVSDKSWVVSWGWNPDGQTDVPADLIGPILVDAGSWHTVALTSAGTLEAWGHNGYGQSTPPAGLTGIVSFAAGAKHNLVVLDNEKKGDPSDDTVVGWGANDYGVATPPADLVGVHAVAASYSNSAALKTDGTVVEWGFSAGGQTNVPTVLRDPDTADVVAIAVGGDHTVALRGNGTVMAWGRNDYGQLNVPSALKSEATAHVIAIAAGQEHTLALKADGTVVAWGRNNTGQTTIPTGLANVIAIDAGGMSSVALRRDGTIAVWGDNSYGQRNIPETVHDVVSVTAGGMHIAVVVSMEQAIRVGALQATTTTAQPVTIPATATSGLPVRFTSLTEGVCAVDAASGTVTPLARGACSIAIDQDGNAKWNPAPTAVRTIAVIGVAAGVTGWGYNPYGQVTAPASVVNPVAVDLGLNHAVALMADGTISAWGQTYYGATAVPAGLGPVAQVSAGDFHTVALLRNGTVKAWGRDLEGQVSGVNNAGLTGVAAISAGGSHTLFLMQDGTVRAYGNSTYGRLLVPANLYDAVAVSAGSSYSLVLRADGSVLAWGRNEYGQTTVPAGLSGVVAIAAGDYHALALKNDGTVVAWGRNNGGQTSVPAGLTGVVAIAAGSYHSMALKADGTVVAWGSTTDGATAVPAGLRSVASIAAGGNTNLAITERDQEITISGPETIAAGGSAWVRATASSGLGITFSSITPEVCTVGVWTGAVQTLGVGSCTIAADQSGNATWHPAPQVRWSFDTVLADQHVVVWGATAAGQADVPGVLDAVDIAAGTGHTIALLRDGTVRGWGANEFGQATPPAGLDGVTAIAARRNWSMALKGDGTVVAWGSNIAGQATPPANLDHVTAIAAGDSFGIALLDDGTVVRWGDSNDAYLSPPADLAGVTAIAAGADHALAVTDGHVVAWGHNANGQLQVPGDVDAVIGVAAGDRFSLALRDDGSVRGWGRNVYGQAQAPEWLGGVVKIAAGDDFAMALTADGAITAWGNTADGRTDVPPWTIGVTAMAAGGSHAVAVASRVEQAMFLYPVRTGAVGATGHIAAWNLADLPVRYGSTTEDICSVDADSGSIAMLATGTCRVTATQAGDYRYLPVSRTRAVQVLPAGLHIVAWGDTADGLGSAPAGLEDVVAVAAGPHHSLALTAAGTVAGWGADDAGQASPPAGLDGVTAIAAGGGHSLAVREDGTIVGWGRNDAQQLNAPDLGGGAYVAVAAGDRHSLALDWGGMIVAWGDNTQGQTTIPDAVNEAPVVGIAAAGDTSYALLADGRVVVWGAGADGSAAPPTDLPSAVAFAAGPGNAVVVLEDGTVRAWGIPDDDRLVVPEGLHDVTSVAAGDGHSLALTTGGTVVGWGGNEDGQATPTSGLGRVVAIAAGGHHSLALVVQE
jgi:alpha-tubulin suppressor-like RCC1 family protein